MRVRAIHTDQRVSVWRNTYIGKVTGACLRCVEGCPLAPWLFQYKAARTLPIPGLKAPRTDDHDDLGVALTYTVARLEGMTLTSGCGSGDAQTEVVAR